MAFTGVIIKSW